MNFGANMPDCRANLLNSLLPYLMNNNSQFTTEPTGQAMNFAGAASSNGNFNIYMSPESDAIAAQLQRILIQSMVEKQNESNNTSLFSHLYSAYFNALLKQFADYYNTLLQMQVEDGKTKATQSQTNGHLSKSNESESISEGNGTAVDCKQLEMSARSPSSVCCSQQLGSENDDVEVVSKKEQLSSASYNDFQDGVTVGYTYDAFFVTDGRSRKRKPPVSSAAVASSSLAEERCPNTKRQLRYVCNECGKNYATSSNLSRHKQTHRSLNSKAAKKCPHCDKVYVSMPALSMHILTHDLKHKCDVCGKAFSRLWLLNGHKRIHSKEKPYGCAHCGKAFADRSNLRAHIQTHSQFKLYKCEFCSKSFALKSYLNKHFESSACCAAALNNSAGQHASVISSAMIGCDRSETATVCTHINDVASLRANPDYEAAEIDISDDRDDLKSQSQIEAP